MLCNTLMLLAQEAADSDPETMASLLGLLFPLLIGVPLLLAVVIGGWKMFEKAGQPGWASLVPIYNLVVTLRIVGAPLWWIVLLCIPGVNFFVTCVITYRTARVFGQGMLGFLALALVPFLMVPVLGFGSARYQAPEPA